VGPGAAGLETEQDGAFTAWDAVAGTADSLICYQQDTGSATLTTLRRGVFGTDTAAGFWPGWRIIAGGEVTAGNLLKRPGEWRSNPAPTREVADPLMSQPGASSASPGRERREPWAMHEC